MNWIKSNEGQCIILKKGMHRRPRPSAAERLQAFGHCLNNTGIENESS